MKTQSQQPSKMILVKSSTHHNLMKLKAELRHTSLDQTINYLFFEVEGHGEYGMYGYKLGKEVKE